MHGSTWRSTNLQIFRLDREISGRSFRPWFLAQAVPRVNWCVTSHGHGYQINELSVFEIKRITLLLSYENTYLSFVPVLLIGIRALGE
jgi:hypothetical protein